jgi:hypothetical protein
MGMSNTTTLPSTSTTVPALATVDLPLAVHALVQLHGQFASIRTVRAIKVKKGCPEIVKESRFTVRIGVNYDNIAKVQENRENGTLPAENAGLIGREWIVFPYILRTLKSGKYLVRCTPVHNAPRSVEFSCNGKTITREEAAKTAYASEFAEREPTEAFDITVDNIVEINGKPV